jgi:hypothetical protein
MGRVPHLPLPASRGEGRGEGRLLLALLLVTACAESSAPPAATAAAVARTAADDSDLWNLAPAGATAIADVDIAALSRSPWSRSLVTGGFAEDRAARLQTFGYDVFADVDRLLFVATEAGGTTGAMTVARGRFDPAKVAASFTTSTPGAVAGRWRDSPLWEGGGRAVALVTPRTLAQGTPEAVRAAIDAAWGVVPDARGGLLGGLRRTLDAERPGPALVLALLVTGEMRARAAGFVELPPGLHHLGARLDLGRDLDLDGRAVLERPGDATVAASIWGSSLHDLGRQRLVQVLGFAPIVDGLILNVSGSEIFAHLHVDEARREVLAGRLAIVLQMLAAQRHQGTATP